MSKPVDHPEGKTLSERLREWVQPDFWNPDFVADVMTAADELERLRASILAARENGSLPPHPDAKHGGRPMTLREIMESEEPSEERYDCPIHGLQEGPDCARC
jgi:hypothetical protein